MRYNYIFLGLAIVIFTLIYFNSRNKENFESYDNSKDFDIEYVNKNWNLNPDFDLSDRWQKGMTYEDYRDLVMKIEKPSLIKWSDKIWLYQFYQKFNLPAPPILYYSNSQDFDVESVICGMKNYCAKPSHLAESEGVLVVKEGKLQRPPFKKFLCHQIPEKYKKYVKGYSIQPHEAQEILKYAYNQRATWEDKSIQKVFPGVIVEELTTPDELKIFVGMGNVWGSYKKTRRCKFTDEEIKKAHEIAERASIAGGADFIRIDVMRNARGGLYINEYTWNPDALENKIVEDNFWKLDKFYSEILK